MKVLRAGRESAPTTLILLHGRGANADPESFLA